MVGWGHVETCALAAAFDGVAYTVGDFRRCSRAGPRGGTASILRVPRCVGCLWYSYSVIDRHASLVVLVVALSVLVASCSTSSAGALGTSGVAGSESVGVGSSSGASGGASSGGASSGGASTAGTEPSGIGGASGGTGPGGAAGAGGALGGVAGSAAEGAAGSGFRGTVPIMVLGSSNELITCWRALLWQKLRAAGITSFDFVGGVSDGPDCGVAGYDKDLQAQSGLIISNLTANQFAAWFSAHPPQIILMHFGGADLLANLPIAGVLKGYSLALAQARLVNPRVHLLIAQHTPQSAQATVVELNAEIVAWALQNTTAESPVSPVDLYTGLDAVKDFSDGVHLNAAGSEKVASRWFAALAPLLKP